jgi:ATP-dependent protease HslVU (ClpYQ) peptidase subunit
MNMPNRPPRSYDEIVRRTVPEPDSSFRPSPEQVRQAFEGFRALDADEQALLERVDGALATSGHDLQRVTVEVERDRVTVQGTVRDHEALARVLDIVREVPGVGEVVDRLVIG